MKKIITALLGITFLGFGSIANAAYTYNFASEGNVHEAGYSLYDSDNHGATDAPHNASNGMPGGLQISASNGGGLAGLPSVFSAPQQTVAYFAYMDGNWKEDAGLGVCKTNTNSCGSDDNQMQGEYIHMEFDFAVKSLSLDITGDHVPVVDNATFWYTLNKGNNWLSIGFGASNPLVETLFINALTQIPNGARSIDYTIQNAATQDAQMYLSSMTVSEAPVPAAIWLFGTALLGFISFSRRTSP